MSQVAIISPKKGKENQKSYKKALVEEIKAVRKHAVELLIKALHMKKEDLFQMTDPSTGQLVQVDKTTLQREAMNMFTYQDILVDRLANLKGKRANAADVIAKVIPGSELDAWLRNSVITPYVNTNYAAFGLSTKAELSRLFALYFAIKGLTQTFQGYADPQKKHKKAATQFTTHNVTTMDGDFVNAFRNSLAAKGINTDRWQNKYSMSIIALHTYKKDSPEVVADATYQQLARGRTIMAAAINQRAEELFSGRVQADRSLEATETYRKSNFSVAHYDAVVAYIQREGLLGGDLATIVNDPSQPKKVRDLVASATGTSDASLWLQFLAGFGQSIKAANDAQRAARARAAEISVQKAEIRKAKGPTVRKRSIAVFRRPQ